MVSKVKLGFSIPLASLRLQSRLLEAFAILQLHGGEGWWNNPR
jgi:hypothetical protein